jgi:hypothetical protein
MCIIVALSFVSFDIDKMNHSGPVYRSCEWTLNNSHSIFVTCTIVTYHHAIRIRLFCARMTGTSQPNPVFVCSYAIYQTIMMPQVVHTSTPFSTSLVLSAPLKTCHTYIYMQELCSSWTFQGCGLTTSLWRLFLLVWKVFQCQSNNDVIFGKQNPLHVRKTSCWLNKYITWISNYVFYILSRMQMHFYDVITRVGQAVRWAWVKWIKKK